MKYVLYLKMLVAGIALISLVPAIYLYNQKPHSLTQYVEKAIAVVYAILVSPVWLPAIIIIHVNDNHGMD